MQLPERTVWFLVVPRTSMVNIAGPWEVLGHANDLLGREAYRLEAFGPSTPGIQTRFGLSLTGVQPLPSRIKAPPHTVIVAGASPANPIPEDHAPLVPWLRQHHPKFKRVVSICTGAFTLGAAGILDDRRATTHWMFLEELGRRFPRTRVIDEGIYVKDGGVWTSAGVTAGIDLSLALVEEDYGHELAMRVAKRMVLFLRRTGNQAQFSSGVDAPPRVVPHLQTITAFVQEHMEERFAVEELAMKVGMSPRTLSRWCRKHLNESPAEFVRRIRVGEARRLLEGTDMSLKEVAARTGLGDPSTLWRIFIHDLGVTPAEYRQRFGAGAA